MLCRRVPLESWTAPHGSEHLCPHIRSRADTVAASSLFQPSYPPSLGDSGNIQNFARKDKIYKFYLFDDCVYK
jgi:hypothetical protein